MAEFKVEWVIEVDAEDAIEAAQLSRNIQLDDNSEATFFAVTSSEGAKTLVHLVNPEEIPEGGLH